MSMQPTCQVIAPADCLALSSAHAIMTIRVGVAGGRVIG